MTLTNQIKSVCTQSLISLQLSCLQEQELAIPLCGNCRGRVDVIWGEKVLNLTVPPKKWHMVYQRENLRGILTERGGGNTSY